MPILQQRLAHVVGPEGPQDEVVYGGLWLIPRIMVAIVFCLEVHQTCRLHLDPLCVCVCVCVCACVWSDSYYKWFVDKQPTINHNHTHACF